MAPEVVVVGRQFTAEDPVDLKIVYNSGVTDADGNIMFKIKGKFLSDRHILFDAAGNPILSLKRKGFSLHHAWKVYRGDSKNSNDLLFSVRSSSALQIIHTEMDVFLASNTSKDNGDFKIKGSSSEKSCTIYAGNFSTVIAQMDMKNSLSSIIPGKSKVSVTVYPNVDYAFIAALIVILEENQPKKNTSSDIHLDRLQEPLQYLLNITGS